MIKAKNNRPNKGKDGGNTQDKEAAYNVKNGSDGKRKTTYGFKAHINAEEDGFIKHYELTAGNVHDSNVFESLLTGKEKETFADSVYKSNTFSGGDCCGGFLCGATKTLTTQLGEFFIYSDSRDDYICCV